MKRTIPQIGNKKKRSELPTVVAAIINCDVSYVRRIIKGTYKPKTETGKMQATKIKETYNRLLNGKKNLVTETKKSLRA